MKTLPRKTINVISLTALFTMADAMCVVFLSVYFWVNSFDIQIVCRYYMTLYAVTPAVFLFAGWYAQAHDRLHAYRTGLALHAIFYGLLLYLQGNAAQHPIAMGILLGITWGIYWAGANTLNFDVTPPGRREYFYGVLNAVTGIMGLFAPLLSGSIIRLAPDPRIGYLCVFGLVVGLYLLCFLLSFTLPSDSTRRPYHIKRALFPGKDQRDWRLAMWATLSMTGSFNLFPVLLSLLMYMKSNNEMSVGAFASFQALAVVVVSYFAGKVIVPRNRRRFMRWGTILLVAAGFLMLFEITPVTLVIFGFLRSFSAPLFGIPYSGIRFDIITQCTGDSGQRIEYISASEVPLAIGRILVLSVLMALFTFLPGNDMALRIMLFSLCALRIITYLLMVNTTALKDGEHHTA